MKKKKLALGKLNLKKSKVATLESNGVTGGFFSWTGTAEPCFPTELGCGGTFFGCNVTNACPTNGCPPNTHGCPPNTNNCPTNGCPPGTFLCNSHSVCPAGVHCY